MSDSISVTSTFTASNHQNAVTNVEYMISPLFIFASFDINGNLVKHSGGITSISSNNGIFSIGFIQLKSSPYIVVTPINGIVTITSFNSSSVNITTTINDSTAPIAFTLMIVGPL